MMRVSAKYENMDGTMHTCYTNKNVVSIMEGATLNNEKQACDMPPPPECMFAVCVEFVCNVVCCTTIPCLLMRRCQLKQGLRRRPAFKACVRHGDACT
jgi:hypothetical protein